MDSEQTLGTDPGEGQIGVGATLSTESPIGPLGMFTEFTIDGADRVNVDISTMNNVGSKKYKKMIGGLREAKTISGQLIYEKTNMAAVLAAFEVDPNMEYTLTFPDGSVWTQDGYMKLHSAAIPMGDKMTQNVSIQLSGEPTFTPAT